MVEWYKARFVATGFSQIYGKNYTDTFHLQLVWQLFAQYIPLQQKMVQKCNKLMSKQLFWILSSRIKLSLSNLVVFCLVK